MTRLFFGPCQSRQQNRGENSDDRYDNEEFDQGKSRLLAIVNVLHANACLRFALPRQALYNCKYNESFPANGAQEDGGFREWRGGDMQRLFV